MLTRRNMCLLLASSACSSPFVITSARAQSADTYPKQTIKIVVGFTPGGAPDITGRVVAQKLSQLWGQPVIVDNRPGAGSAIGAEYVAKSNPDGYTLMCITSAHCVAQAITPKLPYDAVKDFSGISMLSAAPTWVIVSPSLGVTNVKDMVALAKSKPGALNFSSAGVGSFSHFSAELFNNATGIKAQHVPYKGPPEAMTALLAGEVQYYLSPIGAAVGSVRDNKAVAIAITGKDRIPEFPNIPTMMEQGYPDFQLTTWTGLLAPSKTPRPIIAKLNAAVLDILKQPDVIKAWANIGVDTAPTTPEELDQRIAKEVAEFTRVAREANITVN